MKENERGIHWITLRVQLGTGAEWIVWRAIIAWSTRQLASWCDGRNIIGATLADRHAHGHGDGLGDGPNPFLRITATNVSFAWCKKNWGGSHHRD
jgi:hypothetical protein